MSLREFQDKVSMMAHGMTKGEAVEKDICVNCKQPISMSFKKTGKKGEIYSDAGEREYKISGVCETCFDAVFFEED